MNIWKDNTAELIAQSAKAFYTDLQNDPNGRYRSWEYCYINFYGARQIESPDIDYLSLQLSFYLASWGMYRGSSFLLQKDYKIHIPVIEELLDRKYDPLFGIECSKLRDRENQELLAELNDFLERYYDDVRRDVKDQHVKNKLSATLITKTLMGTMGCVPAYDRYFVDGIKRQKVATGIYNLKSVLMLVDFYEANRDVLENARSGLRMGKTLYPQMKLLDMGFWQIGFEADKE